ncbi:MAG TPA: 3-hydroxyacyl-CoA dehydrogenase/enoyl-CoA hydratase family protein [Desulfobacteraceae bacterium]|nr:3-hydroxyacyl-CoA dehydrogenase/enoyl-CoA hydratase family protein [Desulfobacteraceae bacterium]
MNQREKLYPKFMNPLLHKISRPMPEELAVIGAGTIGPDIGYYLKSALAGSRLYLVDVAEEPLKKAENRLENYIRKAVDRGKMSEDRAGAVRDGIVYTTDYRRISGCGLVIEAATENIPLKKSIFKQVEEIVGEDTIITSNTSSIPADRIFSSMKRPGRSTVTHFFAPAWRSLPVEVIRWDGADQEMLDYLCRFFAATGKAPIMTGNAVCFMLDRIFDNWCNEAALLLDQATASGIDKTAEEFVFAGPFFVLNMANGNPIIIETNTLQMEEGAHYKPAEILRSVERWKTHRPGSPVEVPEALRETARDRLLGILFSQSFDIVDRGIGLAEDLNFGCEAALGFKRGPFDIMRDLGEGEAVRVMERFEADRPGFPMPSRPVSEYLDFKRFVLADRIDDVVVVTIRRPQAMNALNDEVNDEILGVLEFFSADPSVRGFVITGYGLSAFCAGADIGRFPSMLGDAAASADYARACAGVQRFMDRSEKPVVAAVNGMALGGGLELAIRCHGIVAVPGARFQFPEITLGILPGIGGCAVPYRKWPGGAREFHQMLTLGKSISVEEARKIGLVEAVADSFDGLIAEAVKEVVRLDGNITRISDRPVEIPPVELPEEPKARGLVLSREAVEIVKKTIEACASAGSFEESLEAGYRGFGEIACTEAAAEGIGAFLEKRRPEYKK